MAPLNDPSVVRFVPLETRTVLEDSSPDSSHVPICDCVRIVFEVALHTEPLPRLKLFFEGLLDRIRDEAFVLKPRILFFKILDGPW